jgi:hypothetical protein|tara:strand:- start:25505 stop:25873 length:369 start_codon:yes stop_codon:yes gene_type:complete
MTDNAVFLEIRNEFLNNPITISEEKINILKNYYYIWTKQFLNIDKIESLKMGTNKNKNVLWFNSIYEPDFHLLLYFNDNEYITLYKNFKKSNNKNSISLKRKEKNRLLDDNSKTTCKMCRIL